MAATHEYLIRRHGSNAANQPGRLVEPVGIVTATSWREAVEKAEAELDVDLYNNQHLEAVPQSKARVSEWNYAVEDMALRAAHKEVGE